MSESSNKINEIINKPTHENVKNDYKSTLSTTL